MTLDFGIITVMQMYRLEIAPYVDISNSIQKLKLQVLNLKIIKELEKHSIKLHSGNQIKQILSQIISIQPLST